MIRAIIIDDEEKSRKLLRNLLSEFCPEVQVLKMADGVESGVKLVTRLKPDLLFLDIVMPDENGFELLSRITDIDFEVVFTTAYNEYAIRAIRVCALDYLLKPIDVEDLQAAVARARAKMNEKIGAPLPDKRLTQLIENYKAANHLPQKIGFPTPKGVKFYQINEITACKADGNYTTIYFRRKDRLELVSKTLKEFEELLVDYDFVRTHRSFLVNLNHVKEYQRFSALHGMAGEGGCLVVSSTLSVPVSRDRRKQILERISKPF